MFQRMMKGAAEMSRQYEKVKACYEYCRTVTDFQPRVGLILGSGLGNYARNMKVECEIPYGDIPDFPVSTVAGHDGRFLFGFIGDVPAVVMKGRVHFYEGYTPQEVVLPIRVMKLMGIEVLFLTNASGGINRNFQVGDFMMITDQISNFVPSPLIGENVSELGLRFPDMSNIYDPELQELIRKTSKEEGIPIREGVYVQTTGPNYESAGRDPHVCGVGRGCGGHEHGRRGAGGTARGHPGVRHFLRIQYGERDL